MAGKVANFKVCNPLKLRSGLTGKKPAICHYSYNLPLGVILNRKQMKLILTILTFNSLSKFLLSENGR